MWNEVELKKDIWTPVIEGDLLEGVVVNKEETQYGIIYHVETEESDGFVKTPQHKILQALLENVEVGKRIRIIYKGEKPTNKGNPVQLYKLLLWEDDKKSKK